MPADAPPRAAPPKGAGRPKSAAKRDAILEAAFKSFSQEPYDRVSLEAIAADAGVSKVTIYSHFPNKDALFIAAISAGCEEIFARVSLAAESGPIEDALYDLGCEFLEMIFDPEVDRLHAIILSEGPRKPALPQMFYERVVHRSTTILADYLAAQTKLARLKISDPYIAAVQFLSIVQGEFRYRVELGLPSARKDEIEPYVRACVDTLLRAWRAS